MYAKITKDHLTPPDEENSRQGLILWDKNKGETFTVRTLDDDLEIYYEASCDDEAFEAFFEWSMHDAGSVVLQQLNSKGEWEDVIS